MRKKAPPPPVKTRSPVQARSRETVRAIVGAASQILANEGKSKVTMARIAKLAGVSPGTLYEYFSSATSVLRAVEDDTWVEKARWLAAELPSMPERSDQDAVRQVVGLAVDFLSRGKNGITVGDPGTLTHRLEALEQFVTSLDARLASHGRAVRRSNRRLALTLAVKSVFLLTWLGQRDHPEALASGELKEEIADIIARYLMADSR